MSERETLDMLLEQIKEAEKLVYNAPRPGNFETLITGIRRRAYLEWIPLAERQETPFKNCMAATLLDCKFDGEEPTPTDWAARLYRIHEHIESTIASNESSRITL